MALMPDADALMLLRDWKVMKALGGMRRLVLAHNPLLGRRQQAALGSSVTMATGFVEPQSLWWLETRVLRAAPLQLLDLRHTGECLAASLFSRQACVKALLFCQQGWPAHSSYDCRCCLQASAMPPALTFCFSLPPTHCRTMWGDLRQRHLPTVAAAPLLSA